MAPLRAATAIAVGLGLVAAVAGGTAGAGARATHSVTDAQSRQQSTGLVSRATGGGIPDGPSVNPVLSNDRRFERAIAFESDASNLVAGDKNGQRDVFVVLRGNHPNNKGTSWKPGKTIRISRTKSGAASNGPSFLPSIDGSFDSAPTCVGFLSAASNIVPGDSNGEVDAFVKGIKSGAPRRLAPSGARPKGPATAVAVSGNCKEIAFVIGGRLFVSKGGGRGKRVAAAKSPIADPSFSTGRNNDLVYGGRGGVYLSKNGTGSPKLVGAGGRNPAYNDVKRHTVAYEKRKGAHMQIAYHDIGKRERIISSFHGQKGDGDSRNPVIGNSGYYVTFETDASNLQTNASGQRSDRNGQPDIYLYTDTRKITLVQSVRDKGSPVAGGGKNPGMSFYANYILFDSPAPLGSRSGGRQIFMRYLGGI
ncbi:MAG: hypothetical protein QOF55_12 [Thermoleophilaceae bacterium]|jgi:hypothetical protein|nr:hypothetical protein [Thermoleophilaceae bacterium]